MKHTDLAGNAVSVGDYVVYASLWSRSAVLKFGKVVRLAERKGYNDNQPTTPTVRLRSVDRDYDGNWSLQNKGKETTLGFMDRLLVVNSDMVPKEALRVLEMNLPGAHTCGYPCNLCQGK